jgi:hypothetical protein
MLQVSFRLVFSGSFPRLRPGKPAALVVFAALLAGCGGHSTGPVLRRATGPSYHFAYPSGWRVMRTARSVTAAGTGEELVSVTVFRLAKRYRPALWPKVVPVLDGVAAQLSSGLHGHVASRSTTLVAGRRARRYELEFRRDGKDLVERIVFLLDGRREYQLLCRFEPGGKASACSGFLATFRLA